MVFEKQMRMTISLQNVYQDKYYFLQISWTISLTCYIRLGNKNFPFSPVCFVSVSILLEIFPPPILPSRWGLSRSASLISKCTFEGPQKGSFYHAAAFL